MSLSTVWNFTDSSVTAPGNLTPAALNFTADFAKKEASTNSAALVNTTSPLDRQETVKFSWSPVNNVYSGSGIDASAYSQNKTGVSVLAQVNTVLSVTDSVTNKRVDLPLSAHVVMKVPNHEAITADILQVLANRVVGLLYEQSGSAAGPRLNNLVRGAVLPKALA